MGFSRYQINIFAFAGTPTHPALPWVGGTEVVEGDKDQLESLFGSFPACVDMETIGDLEIEQVADHCKTTSAMTAFDMLNHLMSLCADQYPESNCCLMDVTYLGYEEAEADTPSPPEPMPF